ncbi:uncharacterized protein N7479_001236 [Penicillium vulpinum]|uniref:SnoaL-like domain-containing protein n=1 Tax=Penicillium vulpinum TaxID=29845 RepID=A0A1V6RYY4_9EURO|nr:uncharacterized protein N7479_001236 [Penicillium vulpinum]KAJ5971318.1 hypothetical protein N7479_001236 [Penicillium vulpinum]OQE06975.1 hypothetical protein PENVUL_c015G08302 [Penicillium vulpinum]
MAEDFKALTAELASLKAKVSRISDEAELRKLHFKYGYYLDKCLYQEVVDMWSQSPDAFIEFHGGRYRGKEGIHRLFIDRFAGKFVNGRNGPVQGVLLDHAMLQDIIDVNEEGNHAWGRMRTLMSAGNHESIAKDHPRGLAQWWEAGLYKNEYIKEDGVWKPYRYRYFPFWQADFDKGWSHTKPEYVPFPKHCYPEDPLGPDQLVETRNLWPDTKVVPFHYPHPVTGKQVKESDLLAPTLDGDLSKSSAALSIRDPDVPATKL